MRNMWTTTSLLGALIVACAWTTCSAMEIATGSNLPPGYKIIEGDIIVPIDFTFEGQSGGRGTSGVFTTSLWTGGTVPYAFNANVSAANQTAAINAMAEWEAVANLNFVARTTQSDYIAFNDSDENSSMVGRQGGKQTINIYNWNMRFRIAHEIAHSLGCWHEQSRTDRDTYLIVDTSVVEADARHNYDRHDEADVYGPYDFGSVMHYGECYFVSGCSCPADCRAMTVRAAYNGTCDNGDCQSTMGQRDHLSRVDILTMQMLYPNAGDVFVDKDYTGATQNGAFRTPYKTFTGGYNAVASGGRVIVQPGTYTGCVRSYTKRAVVRAPLGGVVLKQ